VIVGAGWSVLALRDATSGRQARTATSSPSIYIIGLAIAGVTRQSAILEKSRDLRLLENLQACGAVGSGGATWPASPSASADQRVVRLATADQLICDKSAAFAQVEDVVEEL
jgi:hypothetical protein